MKYVAYMRVSSEKQFKIANKDRKGLYIQSYGILDQKISIQKFLKPGDEIIKEVIEIESAARPRVALDSAIRFCLDNDYTLLIARLDRLSRSVAFVSALLETKVKFVCIDMPEADTFTIQIMSVMAQRERDNTSRNTKRALDLVRKYGSRTGNMPGNREFGKEALKGGMANAGKLAYNDLNNPLKKTMVAYTEELRKARYSWRKIFKMVRDAGFVLDNGNPPGNDTIYVTYIKHHSAKYKKTAADWYEAKEKKREELDKLIVLEQIEIEKTLKKIQEGESDS